MVKLYVIEKAFENAACSCTKEAVAGRKRPRLIALLLVAALFSWTLGFISGDPTPAVYAASAKPVQTFFVPMPETEVRASLKQLYKKTGPNMHGVISIVATGSSTIIYYDHWEDGYEINPTAPDQTTTQVWGDDDPSNGIPPGFASDVINAGDVVSLENDVLVPRNPFQIRYDGRDKFATTKVVAATRAVWATKPGPVMAGAVQFYSTHQYGLNFEVPVGENVDANDMFEYTSLFVMASEHNTAVDIDTDGDGVVDVTETLNQGQSYQVNGRVNAGAALTATHPVQAHLITGDVKANYESRWYTLFATEGWSDGYFSPVGTMVFNDPSHVFVYNPNALPITVNFETRWGTGSFAVPAGDTVRRAMPFFSGAHFFTADGSEFFAIGTVDSDNSNSTHDWGFTLVPEGILTSVTVVGWGPGSDDLSENGNPVWVTAENDTTLYVDYDADPSTGPLTDPDGNQYDVDYALSALASLRAYDNSDNDQTGMRLYTVDETRIAAAWGQDPATAEPGNPFLDMGTTVLPIPEILIYKDAVLESDLDSDGLVDPGERLAYTITVDNNSAVGLASVIVSDTLFSYTSYVTGTTQLNSAPVPDDSVPPALTELPLDEGGMDIGPLPVGATTKIDYIVTVSGSLPSHVASILNQAGLDADGVPFATENDVPVETADFSWCGIDFTDAGGAPVAAYVEEEQVTVTVNDGDQNTDPGSLQTVIVNVLEPDSGDRETLLLTETANDSGVFRGNLPSSDTGGQMAEDGTLYARGGETLQVIYTDPVYATDNCTDTVSITLPVETKVLYLSEPGQGLDRVDPMATGDSITSNSVGLSGSSYFVCVGSAQLPVIQDAWIQEDNPDANKNDAQLITKTDATKRRRALLQFDLASLPDGAIITAASFNVNVNTSNADQTVNIKALTPAWDEGQVTWNDRLTSVPWTTAGGDFDAAIYGSFSPATTGYHSADVTTLVQGWFSGTLANNGLILDPSFAGNSQATYDSSSVGGMEPYIEALYEFTSMRGCPATLRVYSGQDAWIQEDNADANKNDAQLITKTDATKRRRALLQFNLSSLPDGAIITAANFSINVNTSSADQTVNIKALTPAWDEGQVTWNDRLTSVPWTTAGGDFDAAIYGSFAPATNGFHSVDVTTLVQGWFSGTVANRGLILDPSFAGNSQAIFDSSIVADKEPYVEIKYLSPQVSVDVNVYQDAWIQEDNADANKNDAQLITKTDATKRQRALLQFNLSSLPDGAIITAANFSINVNTSNADQTVNIKALTPAWDEGQVTWNDRLTSVPWTTAGGDFDAAIYGSFAPATNGFHSVDVTTLVQGWFSGTVANRGLILDPSFAGNSQAIFDSSIVADKEPYVRISYTAPPATSIRPSTLFTQTTALTSDLILPAGGVITVTNYVSVTNGAMPPSPAITATLGYSGTTIATLTNPSFVSNQLTWTGALVSDTTVPAGEQIILEISTAEPDVTLEIEYDSDTHPSKAELPTTSVISVDALQVYDAPYPASSPISSTVNGGTVYVRATVSDPFGADDIVSLNITITQPVSGTVNANLTDVDVVTSTPGGKTYEYIWETSVQQGIYEVLVSANEGYEGVTDEAATLFAVSFLDTGTPSFAAFTNVGGDQVDSYVPDSLVCVRVTDIDQNEDPLVTETITATVTSASADSETIVLTETLKNTGVYTACLLSSTTLGASPDDGTLYAPEGDLITVTYFDPDYTDDTSNDSAVINTLTPELATSKTLVEPADGSAVVGDTVRFDILVSNPGPTELTSVTITDTFDAAALTYQSATVTPTAIVTPTIIWDIGPIPSGADQTISAFFSASAAAAPATNGVSAAGVDELSTAVGPITTTAQVTITRPELTLSKLLLDPVPGPAGIDEAVTFQIDVTNTGTTDVSTLPLSDNYSAACLTYDSATPPAEGAGGGAAVWNNLGPLTVGNGTSVVVTFTVAGPCSPAVNTGKADLAEDVNGDPVPSVQDSATITTVAASIGDFVWHDFNRDGVQDPGEPGIPGVTISLTLPSTAVITAATDVSGTYQFTLLASGAYTVTLDEDTLPGSHTLTTGTNPIVVTLTRGQVYTGADFGYEGNDPPTFTSTPVTNATEDTAYAYNVTASDIDPGEILTITATIQPSWLTLNDNGDGTATLSGTPTNADVGDHSVGLLVQDSAGLTDTQAFTITVANTNDAPSFTSTPVTSATEDVAYTYAITTTDPDVGDVLTITATIQPGWLTLNDNGDGSATLSGTPTNSDVGDHGVGLLVQDSAGLTDTQAFTVTVANTNDAPTFTSTPVTSATEDVAYTYAITATDPDVGDILTITATVQPGWLTLNDNGDGTASLSGTPTNSDVGDHSVELQVRDTAAVTDTQIFTITVVAPKITVAPTSLSFGNQDVDAGATVSQTVVITNDGTADLSISSVTLVGADAGQFAIESDTGEATLTPGGTRTVQISFDPTSTGAKSADLRVLSDDSDEDSVDVALSGAGADQEITVAPSSLSFGNQDVDAGATVSQTVVITNDGTADLSISSVTLVGADAGQFAIESDTGEGTLAPGSTRTVQISFDPTSTGAKSADMRVLSDDSDEGTVDVALSGAGADQEITVAPLSLSFGSQDVDVGATVSQTVTITNDGTADLSISSITVVGADASQFSVESDTGEATLTPGSTRTVQVSFDPSSTGAKTADLRILSDDSDEGTVDVALSGSGTDQEITIVPLSLIFGDQDIDAGATVSQTVVITNDGTADLSITTVSIVGADASQFSIDSDTGEGTLAPGSTRTVQVSFDPTSTGAKSADLRVLSDDSDEGSVDVALSGAGADQEITVAPLSLSFGSQDVDAGATVSQTVVITNDGTADLNISGVSIVGTDASQFSIEADTGEATLTPGGIRTLQVSFDPNSVGAKSADLRVISDDSDEGTVDVALSGTGVDQEITVAPLSLSFGSQDVDVGATVSLTVVITNEGTTDLGISSVSIVGTDASQFSVDSDTGEAVVTPGTTRTVQVSFDPTSTGAKSADVRVLSDDSDESTVDVALSGTGVDQEITFAPSSLNFGSQDVDAGAIVSLTVVITNDGTADLGITSVAIVGADATQFAIESDTGEATLTPGSTRTVQVSFDATSTGAKLADLRVVSDDSDEGNADIALSGTGTDQEITVTPSSLSFGSQDVDVGPTVSQTVVITNDGTTNLNISSVSIAGADASQFSVETDTGEGTLSPGSTRTVQLSFDPATVGTKSADLRILSDDSDEGTVDVALSGIGINVNDPPAFTSTPVTSASEDVAYTYNVTASDPDVGDILTITATVQPGWLALNDNGDGTATLSGTPSNAHVGDHSVGLLVQDTAGLTDTQAFTITVANTNDAPTFTSTPGTNATEDVAYTYNVTASDPDVGDVLTITATIQPGWLALNDNGDGTANLSGTPTSGDEGDHAVELQVKDAAGATASQVFTITVERSGGNPLPSLSINDVVVTEGHSGTTNASFTVELSAASDNVITVGCATIDGTAVGGTDYLPISSTPLTFPVGVTEQTITVQVLGDTLDEDDETFTVSLTGPTNAIIADDRGLGTIIDDDSGVDGQHYIFLPIVLGNMRP